MAIKIGSGGSVPKNIYVWVDEEIPYLCFTAKSNSSSVQLNKKVNPTSVTLETSRDGSSWSTYTFGTTILLSNGDKVYFRNTSTSTTGFSTDVTNYYQFLMGGTIEASGDVTYLINKNGTTTLSSARCFNLLFDGCTALITAPRLPATTLTQNCYAYMFRNCTGLTTVPSLPATTLADTCYRSMFYGCSNLVELPKLPATTLTTQCYADMFNGCSKIKLSASQTGEYQTAYRIPTTGTGSTGTNSLNNMFTNTGGTFTGTPTINTTYYTSNTVV